MFATPLLKHKVSFSLDFAQQLVFELENVVFHIIQKHVFLIRKPVVL